MEQRIPVYVSYSGRNGEATMQIMETVLSEGYGLIADCMLPTFDDMEARVHRLIENVARDGMVVAVINDEGSSCPYLGRDLRMASEANAKILAVLVGDAQLPQKYEPVLCTAVCRVSEIPTQQEMLVFRTALQEISKKKNNPYF